MAEVKAPRRQVMKRTFYVSDVKWTSQQPQSASTSNIKNEFLCSVYFPRRLETNLWLKSPFFISETSPLLWIRRRRMRLRERKNISGDSIEGLKSMQSLRKELRRNIYSARFGRCQRRKLCGIYDIHELESFRGDLLICNEVKIEFLWHNLTRALEYFH